MIGESFLNPEFNTGKVVKYLEIDSNNIANISNNYGEIISLFRKIVILLDDANLQSRNNNDL